MENHKAVLTEIAQATPTDGRRFEQHHAPVKETDDLKRILALPRRLPPDQATQEAMAAEMTARLRRDNPHCRCARLSAEGCITQLRPTQGWALYEAAQCGGMAGFIEVGGGKTGLDVLLPMVVPNCQLAMLLIRPNDVDQLFHDYDRWSQHFQVPNLVGGKGVRVPGRPSLEVVPYSMMSQQSRATYFAERRPDVLIADEAQNLKDRKSSRTGRFLRHFAAMPGTRLFCHSGSMTTRGLEDFAHLLALALREGSPLPLYPSVVEAWAEVVNPAVGGAPADPGNMMRLVAEGETLEQALNRRIVETSGVIATSSTSVPARLRFHEANAGNVPAAVLDALRDVRTNEQRPDGEELLDQLEVASVAMQVACGLYMYWAYPRGEPEELIAQWFERRQSWNREMRDRLKHREDGLDSPGLLRNAAERAWGVGKAATTEGPKWKAASFKQWFEIECQVVPEPRVKWIDTYLAEAAVRWAQEAPGIVWAGYRAFRLKVAELGKLPEFGGGDDAAKGIREERGDRSIVASVKAHGVGRNLQAFNRGLLSNQFSDGGGHEQLIGRMHRYGQRSPVVDMYFFRHTSEFREAFAKAEEYARYAQAITGGPQRLLYGERTWK